MNLPADPDQPPSTVAPASYSADERQMAMFCHLSGLAGYLVPAVGNIVGPLILWLMKREQMPFVDSEGRESVNFQISVTIYALISGLLSFFCIGIVMLIALGIFDLIVIIMASIDASSGKPFRYPLCIRFIK